MTSGDKLPCGLAAGGDSCRSMDEGTADGCAGGTVDVAGTAASAGIGIHRAGFGAAGTMAGARLHPLLQSFRIASKDSNGGPSWCAPVLTR